MNAAVPFRLRRRVLAEGLDGILVGGRFLGRRVLDDGLDGILYRSRARTGRRIDADALDGIWPSAPIGAPVEDGARIAFAPATSEAEYLPTEVFASAARTRPHPPAQAEVEWRPTEVFLAAEVEVVPTEVFAPAPLRATPATPAPEPRRVPPPRPAPRPPPTALPPIGWLAAFVAVAATGVAALGVGLITALSYQAWELAGPRAPAPVGVPASVAAPTPAPVAAVSFDLAAPPPPATEEPPPAPAEASVTIGFEFNDVEPGAALDRAVALARGCAGTVLITGHTCALGTDEVNDEIGLTRARDVQQRLLDEGIAADRIVVRSAGSREPIGDNATELGRRQNRRVTILCQSNHQE